MWASWAWSTATSSPARSTACSGVRCFTQDDAHLFMTPEQLKEELKGVVRLFDEVYSVFGLSYKIELSTMPEDPSAPWSMWEHNQEILKEAITEMGKDFEINEGRRRLLRPQAGLPPGRLPGPHLAVRHGAAGQPACPSASSWSTSARTARSTGPSCSTGWCWAPIERFIGVITEHFAGKFPLWLSPVQAVILPIAERHHAYAQQLQQQLEAAGLRVECDTRSEKIGYKIREAQLQKTPYMLVVGDKEQEDGTVSRAPPQGRRPGLHGPPGLYPQGPAEVASKEIK